MTLRTANCSAQSQTASPNASGGKPSASTAGGSGPPRPEWIVQLGIGTGRPPAQVHVGDCYAVGDRRRPIDRDEARRLLASGLPACPHSQPDIELRILDGLC
ncbi:DUF6233 domain-containing protein [Streptomyces olindensis]|uniref:DUF6233 domain-containing protein n=1 Tax=Streptomyces olindensis TaxID=358823 RepID=UPI0033D63C61